MRYDEFDERMNTRMRLNYLEDVSRIQSAAIGVLIVVLLAVIYF